MIALTHMRTPNDIKLAENCEDIDLILGGHDHVYEVQQVNGRYVVKSGTDFRQFSKITVNFDKAGAAGVAATGGCSNEQQISIEEVNVTAAFPEDQQLKEKLDKYTS